MVDDPASLRPMVKAQAGSESPGDFAGADREVESGSVAVRTREGEDLGSMTVDDFITMARERVEARN